MMSFHGLTRPLDEAYSAASEEATKVVRAATAVAFATLREDAEASADDIVCREAAAASDLCCYVTYGGVEDSILGLGLYVHPLTAHQRRSGLPPDFDLVIDYLDAEAFAEGVQRTVQTQNDQDWRNARPSMVSSARKSLNGWLPLYINARHWARAKLRVREAFASLSGRQHECFLRPMDILNVCCGLLTCAVVGFTKGQSATCADTRAAGRCKASEKAVQMYADVHRLLLQMAQEYPEVRRVASERLGEFIRDPKARTRRRTPSLGDLIHCLLIVEEVGWEDLAPTFLPEALRRHVSRQTHSGRVFDSLLCRRSADDLIAAWNDFAPGSLGVSSWILLFCQRVGRPLGHSLEEVQATYDRRWGRLYDNAVGSMVGTCAHLSQHQSIMDVFSLMFPVGTHSSADPVNVADCLSELILWSEKYGLRLKSDGVIAAEEWPQLRGPHVLLSKWRSEDVVGRPQLHRHRVGSWTQDWREDQHYYHSAQEQQWAAAWNLHAQSASAGGDSIMWNTPWDQLNSQYLSHYEYEPYQQYVHCDRFPYRGDELSMQWLEGY